MTNTFVKKHPDLFALGRADQYVDDIFEMLSKNQLFGGFTYDDAKILCAFMLCYAAPRDYTMTSEGDNDDYMMFVLCGGFKVCKYFADKSTHTIAEVGPGGVVGEMAFVDGIVRFATCETTMPTDVAVMTRDTLNELLLQYPRLGNKFLLMLLQSMGGKIRFISNKITDAD